MACWDCREKYGEEKEKNAHVASYSSASPRFPLARAQMGHIDTPFHLTIKLRPFLVAMIFSSRKSGLVNRSHHRNFFLLHL